MFMKFNGIRFKTVFILQDMRVVPDNEFEEGKSGNRDRESHKDSNGSEPMDTDNSKMES
jgi:hypothetical protein